MAYAIDIEIQTLVDNIKNGNVDLESQQPWSLCATTVLTPEEAAEKGVEYTATTEGAQDAGASVAIGDILKFVGESFQISQKSADGAEPEEIYVVTNNASEVSHMFEDIYWQCLTNRKIVSCETFLYTIAKSAQAYIATVGDDLGVLDAMAQGYLAYWHYLRSPYFAYGSNMSAEQMAQRCPDAVKMGNATLPNFKFAIDSAGKATIEEAQGSHVQGVVWGCTYADYMELDRCEGVASGCYGRAMGEVEFDMDTVAPEVRERTPAKTKAVSYISLRQPYQEKSDNVEYMAKVNKAAADQGIDEFTCEQIRAASPEGAY